MAPSVDESVADTVTPQQGVSLGFEVALHYSGRDGLIEVGLLRKTKEGNEEVVWYFNSKTLSLPWDSRHEAWAVVEKKVKDLEDDTQPPVKYRGVDFAVPIDMEQSKVTDAFRKDPWGASIQVRGVISKVRYFKDTDTQQLAVGLPQGHYGLLVGLSDAEPNYNANVDTLRWAQGRLKRTSTFEVTVRHNGATYKTRFLEAVGERLYEAYISLRVRQSLVEGSNANGRINGVSTYWEVTGIHILKQRPGTAPVLQGPYADKGAFVKGPAIVETDAETVKALNLASWTKLK